MNLCMHTTTLSLIHLDKPVYQNFAFQKIRHRVKVIPTNVYESPLPMPALDSHPCFCRSIVPACNVKGQVFAIV